MLIEYTRQQLNQLAGQFPVREPSVVADWIRARNSKWICIENLQTSKAIKGLDLDTIYEDNQAAHIIPVAVFRFEHGRWTLCAAIYTNIDYRQQLSKELKYMFRKYDVEFINLPKDIIEAGYLNTREWKLKLKSAIYSPCMSNYPVIPAVKVVTIRHRGKKPALGLEFINDVKAK